MKKLYLIVLSSILVSTSCIDSKPYYPRYTLTSISFIPDSLKKEYREWIKETVRASSQHMTGGDYEDVDETIIQVERTANRLFEIKIVGLKKEIDEHYYNNLEIKPCDFTEEEKQIFDSLQTNKK